MRAVLDQDVDLALLCLIPVPPDARAAVVGEWLSQAHIADKIRKRLARAHPEWGDGTLAARLQGLPHGRPLRRHDATSLAALSDLAQGLAAWRNAQAAHATGCRGHWCAGSAALGRKPPFKLALA